jgi:hypothetical protein
VPRVVVCDCEAPLNAVDASALTAMKRRREMPCVIQIPPGSCWCDLARSGSITIEIDQYGSYFALQIGFLGQMIANSIKLAQILATGSA